MTGVGPTPVSQVKSDLRGVSLFLCLQAKVLQDDQKFRERLMDEYGSITSGMPELNYQLVFDVAKSCNKTGLLLKVK